MPISTLAITDICRALTNSSAAGIALPLNLYADPSLGQSASTLYYMRMNTQPCDIIYSSHIAESFPCAAPFTRSSAGATSSAVRAFRLRSKLFSTSPRPALHGYMLTYTLSLPDSSPY